MSEANREQMRKEAETLLSHLGVPEDAIDLFRSGNILSFSAHGLAQNGLTPEQKEIVGQIEEDYKILVFAVVHDSDWYGETDSYLYVPRDEEEWPMIREEIDQGIAFAYVRNIDNPFFSETGTIQVEYDAEMGALIRIG